MSNDGNFTIARQAVRSRVFDAVAVEFAEWVERTTGEPLPPPGHENVVEALKDGIALCKLVNVIQPGIVPKFKVARSAFAAAENVNQFLVACETLGVRRTDLFLPSDLIGDKPEPLKIFGLLEALRTLTEAKDKDASDKKKRFASINDVHKRVVSNANGDAPQSATPKIDPPIPVKTRNALRSTISPRSALSAVDWGDSPYAKPDDKKLASSDSEPKSESPVTPPAPAPQPVAQPVQPAAQPTPPAPLERQLSQPDKLPTPPPPLVSAQTSSKAFERQPSQSIIATPPPPLAAAKLERQPSQQTVSDAKRLSADSSTDKPAPLSRGGSRPVLDMTSGSPPKAAAQQLSVDAAAEPAARRSFARGSSDSGVKLTPPSGNAHHAKEDTGAAHMHVTPQSVHSSATAVISARKAVNVEETETVKRQPDGSLARKYIDMISVQVQSSTGNSTTMIVDTKRAVINDAGVLNVHSPDSLDADLHDLMTEAEELEALAQRAQDEQYLREQQELLELEMENDAKFSDLMSGLQAEPKVAATSGAPPIPPRPAKLKRGILDLMEHQNTPDFDSPTSPQEDAKLQPGTKCMAKFDFKARQDDELSFRAEDIVLLLEATFDGNWWFGQIQNHRGWFPSNYVDVIQSSSSRTWYRMYKEKGSRSGSLEEVSVPLVASAGGPSAQSMAQLQGFKSQTLTPNRPKISQPSPQSPSAAATPSGAFLTRSSTTGAGPAPSPKTAEGHSRIVRVESMPTPTKGTMKRDPASSPVVMQGEAAVPLLWKDTVDVVVYESLSEKERKRQEVIYELIRTEKDYLKDINFVIENFLKPLQNKKILSQIEIKSLFSNIEQLVPVNFELHKELGHKQKAGPVVETVGDCFLKTKDYFKMYKPYCRNHPYSVIAYQKIRNGKYSKPFRRFEEEMFKRPECRLMELPSFLLKPVQRICKYPLLLKEILKYTEPTHPDYTQLQKAYQVFEELVAVVNEDARQGQNERTIVELQKRFPDKMERLVTPTRVFLLEANVNTLEVEAGKRNAGEPRIMFLFSDILILAKPTEKTPEKVEPLAKYSIDEIACRNVPRSDDTLQLVHVPRAIAGATPWTMQGYMNVMLVAKDSSYRDTIVNMVERARQKYIEDQQTISPVEEPPARVSTEVRTSSDGPPSAGSPVAASPAEPPSTAGPREVMLPRNIQLPSPLGEVIQCHVTDVVRRGGLTSRFKRFSSTQGLLYMVTVQRKPENQPFNHEVYKGIDDFIELHIFMMKKTLPLIKDEAERKKLPDMPPSRMLTTEAVMKQAVAELETFMQKMTQLQHTYPVVRELLSDFLARDTRAETTAPVARGTVEANAKQARSSNFESLLGSDNTLKMSLSAD